MPGPFWTGDEIPLQFEAVDVDGAGPTAATVDVYDEDNSKVVDGATVIRDGTTVSYNVESVTDEAGNYRAVFQLTFTGDITRSHTISFLVQDQTLRFSVYGSIQQVEAMIGDIVTDRQFSDDTFPSASQVTILLEAVAAELNAELKQQGYRVPVRAKDDMDAYIYLAHANSAGAAARTLSSLPFEAYGFPDEQARGGDRREMLDRELWHCLQKIRRQELPATRDVGLASRTIAGSRTDRTTGDVKNPLFKRSMTDYPGSRVLEE